MGTILSFGEIMLRLCPSGNRRFLQCNNFDAEYGGAEANVAVMLACLGARSRFISALPDNDIGLAAMQSLCRYGVDTSCVQFKKGRMGIYYLEQGASQRGSAIIYDRENSAFTNFSTDNLDFDKVLGGVQWFHFTGITCALGDRVLSSITAFCTECKRRNIKISLDINYRYNLWSRQKAKSVIEKLLEYVDVCFTNCEQVFDVFEIPKDNAEKSMKTFYNCGNFSNLVYTARECLSANDNIISAYAYDGKNIYKSEEYKIHIVDRIGGGDAFDGGFIYAVCNGYNLKEALEFAVAASCLKHTVVGDYPILKLSEVLALKDGDQSGRVRR